jgi:hypothetical protein
MSLTEGLPPHLLMIFLGFEVKENMEHLATSENSATTMVQI